MKVAVIDIGSNAIRAAIYKDNKIGAPEIFNEKFRSDLSSFLEMEAFNVKHGTYNILNYFENIFNKLGVAKVICVATEVLRKHKKADVFIKEIKSRYNIDVHVLTGEEEAKFTAEGLISSIPSAKGIAADLGGGSLELAEVYDKKVHRVKSFPIGTKVIGRLEIEDPKYIVDHLSKEFDVKGYDNLYLIGGSLRLIGRCYMDYNRSLIKSLHNLSVEPSDFVEFLTKLDSLQKFQKFYKQYKINKSAIVVVLGLIEYFNPKNIVISTFGLKEGVRFNNLPSHEKEKDICFERILEYCASYVKDLNADSYKTVFKNLGVELRKDDEILFVITLILSQFAANIDRSYKGEWLVNFILSTDIPFNQYQRACLITALSNALPSKIPTPKAIRKILSKSEFSIANIIGAFTKIALLIDGPVLISPSFDISQRDRYLDISTSKALPKNIFDKVCEQLKTIGISKRSISNS